MFLLRDGTSLDAREGDILREANRILEENTSAAKPHRRRSDFWRPFAIGAMIGAAAVLPWIIL